MNEEKIIQYVKEIIKDYNDEIKERDYFEGIIVLNDIRAIQGLLDLYQKEKEKNKKYKNALIEMVNQFAYDIKARKEENEKLYTGGLSVLENAFDILDIDEGIKRKELWNLLEESE